MENYTTIKRADDGVRCLQIPFDAAGGRLDAVLAGLLPEYSRSRIQSWIRDGDVRLDGATAEVRTRVRGGELVEMTVEPQPASLPSLPEDIPLDVVYEDDSILVIDKPAGLVVHPGSGNWQGTLLNGLLHHAPQLTHVPRAGIVHRLDKDTSGLMVVALTLQAQTSLVRQLQARTVRREYLAIVQGRVGQDGRVDAPIGRHATQRTRMAVVSGGREAVTHYRVVTRFAAHTLVRCSLETGRTHQIRVHMQHIGYPLVGDPVYHRRRTEPVGCARAFDRQALHATQLGLLHPLTGEPMLWQRDPPADFVALLNCLATQEATGEARISQNNKNAG